MKTTTAAPLERSNSTDTHKCASQNNPLPRVAYTLQEVADSCGLDYLTIRRRVADKTIKAFKLGGRWLVRASELDKLGR